MTIPLPSLDKVEYTNQKSLSMYDVFQRHRYNLTAANKNSYSWFAQQASLLKSEGYTYKRVLREQGYKHPTKVTPGKLYMYIYDAKHKATLPYWDMYPMVFPFSPLKDGFIGLNMHYIPYAFRIRLLDKLMEIDGTKNTQNVKLKLSWQLIQGSSKLKLLEPCVHRYLTHHVVSQFREIERKDWATAMFLPEQFIGANKTAVWKDSVKKAGY